MCRWYFFGVPTSLLVTEDHTGDRVGSQLGMLYEYYQLRCWYSGVKNGGLLCPHLRKGALPSIGGPLVSYGSAPGQSSYPFANFPPAATSCCPESPWSAYYWRSTGIPQHDFLVVEPVGAGPPTLLPQLECLGVGGPSVYPDREAAATARRFGRCFSSSPLSLYQLLCW